LNEPGTYNALSSKTLKSLINIFKRLNNENKTKVIIIEGSGKGFSAGHDLKEIRSLKNKKEVVVDLSSIETDISDIDSGLAKTKTKSLVNATEIELLKVQIEEIKVSTSNPLTN